MRKARPLALAVLFFFGACLNLDPESSKPVLSQLEGSVWKPEAGGENYRLEFKPGGRVKVRLGGVLGLAESFLVIKAEDKNFALASLYEDTPNPFLMAVTIINSRQIKVYIWEYATDLTLEDAKTLLKERGRLFKPS